MPHFSKPFHTQIYRGVETSIVYAAIGLYKQLALGQIFNKVKDID